MISVSADVFISDIDKERFGIKTARVIGLTAESLPSVLEFCTAERVTLLIARCSMADLKAAQAMERDGFLLMDTLIYYSFDLTRQPVPADNGLVILRPIRIEEEEEIIVVAREAFHGYLGHYHEDPKLDKNKCDEVYIDWAHKAFTARSSENFLVGEIGGKIVGFGVMRINNPDEGEMFLGGIHPDFQGQGMYRSFLYKGMEWCLSKKTGKMIISTQLKNISVQKVLIKVGFEISRGYYTHHKWFD
jgi:ribosomal protein S18 acetylase RimI-like enzyme